MKKMLIALLLLLLVMPASAQSGYEPTNAAPGEFSRMGFLPRNIAMGNAVSMLSTGSMSSYYNPAGAVFQEGNSFQSAYTVLSLDRHLNYLSFTRRFEFFSAKDTVEPREPRATAGVSAGLINSGVSNIDERDNQGYKRGSLSTSEICYFVSLSNKFSKRLALGFMVRIYHYRLYDKVSANATGFDIGAIYRISDNINASLVISDLNAKYKWDTSPLYGNEGTSTTDLFPTTKKLGISYLHQFNEAMSLLGTAEFESNSYGRRLVRAGAELKLLPEVYLRAGIDNILIGASDFELPLPSAGFSTAREVFNIIAGVEYAFVPEPYAKSYRHIIGLNINF
jgi:hypothetical protein